MKDHGFEARVSLLTVVTRNHEPMVRTPYIESRPSLPFNQEPIESAWNLLVRSFDPGKYLGLHTVDDVSPA